MKKDTGMSMDPKVMTESLRTIDNLSPKIEQLNQSESFEFESPQSQKIVNQKESTDNIKLPDNLKEQPHQYHQRSNFSHGGVLKGHSKKTNVHDYSNRSRNSNQPIFYKNTVHDQIIIEESTAEVYSDKKEKTSYSHTLMNRSNKNPVSGNKATRQHQKNMKDEQQKSIKSIVKNDDYSNHNRLAVNSDRLVGSHLGFQSNPNYLRYSKDNKSSKQLTGGSTKK